MATTILRRRSRGQRFHAQRWAACDPHIVHASTFGGESCGRERGRITSTSTSTRMNRFGRRGAGWCSAISASRVCSVPAFFFLLLAYVLVAPSLSGHPSLLFSSPSFLSRSVPSSFVFAHGSQALNPPFERLAASTQSSECAASQSECVNDGYWISAECQETIPCSKPVDRWRQEHGCQCR